MTVRQFKQKLVITLNSDLCVAVGDGFAGNVDTDVCHDDAGVPIIPARRIKGCLKDAGKDLDFDKTNCLDGGDKSVFDELFGVGGSSKAGSLRVSNAVLVGADKTIKSLLSEEDARSPQKVLGLFTYTRAQTAIDIENGSALENTLRFIRVVKQYVPSVDSSNVDTAWTPMQFVADVSCSDNEEQKDLLRKCCKALRAMGYGRNRGFGAVSCKLEESNSGIVGTVDRGLLTNSGDLSRIAYTVRLDSPVMLSQQHGVESADYIPGTSVLGFFARMFTDSGEFSKIFLQGRVRFSPLYPVGGKRRCCPAPPIIVKLKGGAKDGKLQSYSERELYGGTPKALKSGFVSDDMKLVKPATEVIYHNRIENTDNGLYMQRCLKAGQLFSGFIDGDTELVAMVADQLAGLGPEDITFGRSKTAQYSRCTLVGIEKARACGTMSVQREKRYAFLLDSDVLILRKGVYSTDFKDLEKAIQDGLGGSSLIYDGSDIDLAEDCIGTSVRYRVIGGYNSKWNQKKPHVRAFGAGSCIVFNAANDAENVPCEFFIGERQAEGFGRVLMVQIGDGGEIDLPLDYAPAVEDISTCAGYAGSSIEDIRCSTIKYATSIKQKFNSELFGRAFIGRLTRMAEESNSRQSFDERVDSIKSKEKKEAASVLIRGLRNDLEANCPWAQERECIKLLLALGKYYSKQSEQASGADNCGGGVR